MGEYGPHSLEAVNVCLTGSVEENLSDVQIKYLHGCQWRSLAYPVLSPVPLAEPASLLWLSASGKKKIMQGTEKKAPLGGEAGDASNESGPLNRDEDVPASFRVYSCLSMLCYSS